MVVQAHRTSSNLYRTFSNYNITGCVKFCHEFGVVRLYRTYIVVGETRCAGCLCTGSGWFKHTEPLRTFSNYILTEIARYIEFFYMSSGWFDWTEPSLTLSHEFGVVRLYRTFSDYIFTGDRRSAGCYMH